VFQICCFIAALIALVFFLITGFFASDTVAQKDVFQQSNSINLDIPPQNTQKITSWRQVFTEAWQNARTIFGNRDFVCTVSGNFFRTLRVTCIVNFTSIFTEALVSQYGGKFSVGSVQLSTFYGLCNFAPKVMLLNNIKICLSLKPHCFQDYNFVVMAIFDVLGSLLGCLWYNGTYSNKCYCGFSIRSLRCLCSFGLYYP